MKALQRGEGIVLIRPYGVRFPMRAGLSTNITCVHTLAGFEKILGRRDYTQEELQALFQQNRNDFEVLASLLYDADDGEPLIVTVTPASGARRLGHEG
jgi:hypothetical protein